MKAVDWARGMGWWALTNESFSQNSVAAKKKSVLLIVRVAIFNLIDRLTKVEPPHLVERLALPLAAEEEHHRQELDGAVAVQAARARLRLEWPPPPRHEVKAPEVRPLLEYIYVARW